MKLGSIPFPSGKAGSETLLNKSNYDSTHMLKMLELHRGMRLRVNSRRNNLTVSLMSFLGFLERMPDYLTALLLREYFIKCGKIDRLWGVLLRRRGSKAKKLDHKKAVTQDASITKADQQMLGFLNLHKITI